MAHVFKGAFLAPDGIQDVLAERRRMSRGGTVRSFARWRMGDFDLKVVVGTWLTSGDAVLEVNVQLEYLRAFSETVPERLIKRFADACRAVHKEVPLKAAVIGEEVFVGGALLDLWERGLGPKRGDPGTHWPDESGGLDWFPGPAVNLADL
jgi:hypothetical protein